MNGATVSTLVIGLAAAAHMGILTNVKAFVQAKTHGGNASYTASGNFFKWAGAYTLLAIVFIGGSESEKYGQIITALAVLTATGAFVLYYKDIANLFGITLK
jgi:hypothetical protein